MSNRILVPVLLIIRMLVAGASLVIKPSNLTANSQAFIEGKNSGNFTIYASNASSCRFKTIMVPCECFMQVSDNYQLHDDGKLITTFTVAPPDVKIYVPSTHEILNELTVHVAPKLCRADRSTIALEYRSFQVFPGDEETSWRAVSTISKKLQDTKTSLIFGCKHFADPGYYRVSIALGLVNYTVKSDRWIIVNRTNENTLKLRGDSIFPHCKSFYTIGWNLAQCPMSNLHYRIRILAVPEGVKSPEDGALYIEEIGISPAEESSIQLSCSQFDIIFEKYCFDLVSVNRNTSISHTWYSMCVNTEPVERKIGGWSAWTEWSACSETCGEGSQRRMRYCNEPVPKRSKYCDGPLIEAQPCVLSKCPEAMMPEHVATNCTCGCPLETTASTFFASSRHSQRCDGNQTWSFTRKNPNQIVDFIVRKQGDPISKLFYFLNAPYQELVWSSDSHQDYQFSLPLSSTIHIVLWSKQNATRFQAMDEGFTVSYSIRDVDTFPTVANINSCQPFCPETMAIALMAVIFIAIIFIPPLVCAWVTARLKRNSLPDLPLIENKYDSEMIRSGNTETTHISTKNYVAKRSIGIQLSVQSTPRTARACNSTDSPLPTRVQSSLSECDELEYDYYDGTTFPGSLLAPVTDIMYSQIDIDQIIGESELFVNNVEKMDVHTQI